MAGFLALLIICLTAACAEFISPYSKGIVQDSAVRLQGPSAAHPFGTDVYGRDLFTRVIYGGRLSLSIGGIILHAAGLSFIGLGAQPPAPEWGAMLSEAREFLRRAPHLMLFPGLAIFISALSFNLLGDGLRDALDNRLE